MKRGLTTGASIVVSGVICWCALTLTGGGHGTYIPLAIVASPTILIATLPHAGDTLFVVGLVLTPLYWGLIAWVATGQHHRRRSFLFALLAAQYVGAIVFERWSEEGLDRFGVMFRFAPILLTFTLGALIATQLVLLRVSRHS